MLERYGIVKLMSVLEKYNLVEKTEDEVLTGNHPTDAPSTPKEKVVSANQGEAPQSKEPAMPSAEVTLKEEVSTSSPTAKYTTKLTLEEIYGRYDLTIHSSTDTVFMLEDLLSALPDSLTEEVLKHTVKNIIQVSRLNLEALLQDGEKRINALHELMKDYTTCTSKEIANYRATIAELTASIHQLQEKIKAKEVLLKSQDELVQNETDRIEKIVGFFKK